MDPITLEILRNQLESVAEEMGQVLIRGAYSPNIKERQDCSTALFDGAGRMIAQAEHIPVHLGAMPDAVAAVRELDPRPGDAFLLNDPFRGGTHLPDLTLVTAVALPAGGSESSAGSDPASSDAPPEEGTADPADDPRQSRKDDPIDAYAVSRAHHADVGGSTPGSMPAGAREIYQEGLRIPPVRLLEEGQIQTDVLDLVLANVRRADERRADLNAQVAANRRGRDRLRALAEAHGASTVREAFEAVRTYSNERMRSRIEQLPDGTYAAEDVMEGDGITENPLRIRARIRIDGPEMEIDFEGTASQSAGNVNAPRSIAKSAVYFVLRCVTDPDIPPNEGCYRPLTIRIPSGSLLDPEPPAAVVGGNVETSQRVTDVLFAALAEAAPDRVPAQGQGTMNNLIIGRRGADAFTYYETIGGGSGGTPTRDGLDGAQVGMTNTLNTPIEALEAEYPLEVERYELRAGSGGDGRHRGGLGLVRSVTVRTDATVSLLTERRRTQPHGVAGGRDGASGANEIDGEPVAAKITREVPAGTTVTVRTPGGGGHGPPAERGKEDRARDEREEKR